MIFNRQKLLQSKLNNGMSVRSAEGVCLIQAFIDSSDCQDLTYTQFLNRFGCFAVKVNEKMICMPTPAGVLLQEAEQELISGADKKQLLESIVRRLANLVTWK